MHRVLAEMSKCFRIPDEMYDNGLNVRCSKCKRWVTKKIVKEGLCPDCRRKKFTIDELDPETGMYKD